MHYCYYESPVGQLLLTGRDRLETLNFPLGKTRKEPDWIEGTSFFSKVLTQLDAYFDGSLRKFTLAPGTDLKIQGTRFQERVWHQLLALE